MQTSKYISVLQTAKMAESVHEIPCIHTTLNLHIIGIGIDGYTNGTGYYKHIDCLGTESSLSSCTVTDNSNCLDSHGDSVGVRCTLES